MKLLMSRNLYATILFCDIYSRYIIKHATRARKFSLKGLSKEPQPNFFVTRHRHKGRLHHDWFITLPLPWVFYRTFHLDFSYYSKCNWWRKWKKQLLWAHMKFALIKDHDKLISYFKRTMAWQEFIWCYLHRNWRYFVTTYWSIQCT